MQLPPDKLSARLQAELAAVYCVTGDEPLQQQEAADAVRAACRAQGFTERVVMQVQMGFDWQQLHDESNALSLFAERRLLELRLTGAAGQAGGKALAAWLDAPPEDTVLLIVSPRLDKRAQQAAWFRAADKLGVIVNVWPVDRSRFARWLRDRAAVHELDLTDGAAALLAERVENNMLAAAQELEKLRLLLGAGRVDEDAVLSAVADSSRFSVYDVADAMLAGDGTRISRVLRGLREEGVDNVLLLWAVARELRALASVAAAVAAGKDRDSALRAAGVWQRRKSLFNRALQRGADWQSLLHEAAETDRAIKGLAANPDERLEALILRGAGVPIAL